jgi:hypothetical protein
MRIMHPGGSAKSKLFLLALVLAAAPTKLTRAHHSFAASYFPDRTVTIDGKVVQFLFRNPHSFLDVAAPDETRHDQTWVVEWGGGGQLDEVERINHLSPTVCPENGKSPTTLSQN